MTTIGESAFTRCTSLTQITIPESVITIGDNAFSYCKKLSDITLSNSMTTIENGTFYYCEALTNVVIPKNITTIEEKAFLSAPLTEIHVKAETPPSVLNESSFSANIYSSCYVYVPKGHENSYKTATTWSKFKKINGE